MVDGGLNIFEVAARRHAYCFVQGIDARRFRSVERAHETFCDVLRREDVGCVRVVFAVDVDGLALCADEGDFARIRDGHYAVAAADFVIETAAGYREGIVGTPAVNCVVAGIVLIEVTCRRGAIDFVVARAAANCCVGTAEADSVVACAAVYRVFSAARD